MAAVLQAQTDAPKVLQPADNPDVDIVPLRFGVKYASEQPMLALEYRDKASGELALKEIPLTLADDSKALEVYAALKESHARFLAPSKWLFQNISSAFCFYQFAKKSGNIARGAPFCTKSSCISMHQS